MCIELDNESKLIDKIINYKCRFRGRKKGNNFLPFSSELFLRWGEVGRIVDISPPFISKGGWEGCLWGKRVESFSPLFKAIVFWVAWGDRRFGCF